MISELKLHTKATYKKLCKLLIGSFSFLGFGIIFLLLVLFLLLNILSASASASLALTEVKLPNVSFGNSDSLPMNSGSSGERYKWNDVSKLATVSNNQLRNLYKFCMLHYEALNDLGVSDRLRMDAPIGFFKIESGYFFKDSDSDILKDLTSIGNSYGYQGIYQISGSYVNHTGVWNWTRYKHASGRSTQYVPDAVYWVTNNTVELYDKILKIDKSVSDLGHYYGSHLKKACDRYGVDWTDPIVQSDLSACTLYINHAGGNWHDDWGDAYADFLVCIYKTVFDCDFQNISVLSGAIDSLDSYHIQRSVLGNGQVMNGKINFDASTIKLETPLFKYSNGSSLNKSLYQLYKENTKVPDYIPVIEKYGNVFEYTGAEKQACMAGPMGLYLPAIGEELMLESIEAIGYKRDDFVFDNLGYLCFKQNQTKKKDSSSSNGTSILTGDAFKLCSQVVCGEAGCENKDATNEAALASNELVALAIYNRIQKVVGNCNNDYNEAAFQVLMAANQFLAASDGNGACGSYTHNGITVCPTKNASALSDAAVMKIFSSDDAVRKSAIENVKNHLSDSPTLDQVSNLYYFVSSGRPCGTYIGTFDYSKYALGGSYHAVGIN